MNLRVHSFELRVRPCQTRIPFRFGIATLTSAPLALLRLECETANGQRVCGHASDLLVPKWFEKDPDQSVDTDVRRLMASVNHAGRAIIDATTDAPTVFEAWWRAYHACVGVASDADAMPPLVRGFGVALVERALIDAACHASGEPFTDAIRRNILGLDLARFDPALANINPIAPTPRSEVHLRHTVGLLDPIETAEIQPEDRVEDGLPQSLEEDIATYGLQYFKIKVNGDLESDLDRLRRIQRVLQRHSTGTPRYTLDGNEQFASIEDLVMMFERIEADPELAQMLDGLLYVEQPLARAHTFDPDRNTGMDALRRWTQVIIDEADGTMDAFPRAAALGYSGVSIKNCKGVFRAIANAARCRASDGRWFQSGEDLTNLPCLALQQDLLTMAALGMTHVERNGHHYFNGLGHLPETEASAALAAHDDLYEPDPHGVARLSVRDGVLHFASLATPGYGDDTPIDWDAWSPADAWAGFEAPST